MVVQRNADRATRPYRMGARLEQQEQMRERIAKATFELHSTVGPARTTISAIAERAGVQRHTVYHHFPDLVTLFKACTAHGLSVIGPPDPETWRVIPDPAVRVQAGLRELYDFFQRNARLIGNVYRDILVLPEGPEGAKQFIDLNEAWFDALTEGWPDDSGAGIPIHAALRHAMEYATWQSLTMNGLSGDEAADAMTVFITLMAEGATSPATLRS